MSHANERFDVTHVSQSLTRLGGGVSRVAWDLGDAQRQLGHRVAWSCLRDAYSSRELAPSRISPRTVVQARSFGPRQMPIAPGIRKAMDTVIRRSDVVHVHGIWSTVGHTAGSLCRKRDIPFLVAPHGMLDTWALKHRAWRKKAARWFVEEKFLRAASCVHALVREECEAIRRFGYQGPIALIPNGVDLAAFERAAGDSAATQPPIVGNGRRIILFLGRVHPKKGLRSLLQAWKRVVRRDDWCLVVAGPDENNHRQELQRLTHDQNLTEDVLFLGATYGNEKLALLRQAEVFVLPSHSEGFSMAVLEALASSLPVIVTTACNFPELSSSDAGQVVAPTCETLTAAIQRFVDCRERELWRIGQNGKRLVETKYRWDRIAALVQDVYLWIHGRASIPDCVQMTSSKSSMLSCRSATFRHGNATKRTAP